MRLIPAARPMTRMSHSDQDGAAQDPVGLLMTVAAVAAPAIKKAATSWRRGAGSGSRWSRATAYARARPVDHPTMDVPATKAIAGKAMRSNTVGGSPVDLWSTLAATSIRAELPSGKAPTTPAAAEIKKAVLCDGRRGSRVLAREVNCTTEM